MNTNTHTNDSELDVIIERMAYRIGESKDERRDDTSQIFAEMKQSLEAYANRLATTRAIEEAKAALVLSAGMETFSQFVHYQEARIADLTASLQTGNTDE